MKSTKPILQRLFEELPPLTTWFRAKEKPVHVGWYECWFGTDTIIDPDTGEVYPSRTQMLYFRPPNRWSHAMNGPDSAFASGPGTWRDYWRGLSALVPPWKFGRYVLHPTEAVNVRRMMWQYSLFNCKETIVVAPIGSKAEDQPSFPLDLHLYPMEPGARGLDAPPPLRNELRLYDPAKHAVPGINRRKVFRSIS